MDTGGWNDRRGERLRPEKGKWYPLNTLDGLVNDSVYWMLIDLRQKMCFGTEAGPAA